jgi:hypothetical protein
MFECGAPHGTADPRATPAARRRPPSPSCGDSTASRRGCAGASCGTGALLAVDPDREMTVLQMPLRGTLLARAVSGGGGWECLVGCMRRRQPCGWSCSVCADGVCPGLLCTSLHPRACIAALYLSDAAAHRCWQPRSLQRRRPALLTTQPPTSRTLGGWSGGQELGLLRRRLRMQMNRLSGMRQQFLAAASRRCTLSAYAPASLLTSPPPPPPHHHHLPTTTTSPTPLRAPPGALRVTCSLLPMPMAPLALR